jgi:transposase-like protein
MKTALAVALQGLPQAVQRPRGDDLRGLAYPALQVAPGLLATVSRKKSRSSHQLAKDLGVTQKTAWFMAHRIRLAFETENYNRPLSGEVEIDQTYIGGSDRNKHRDLVGEGETMKRAPWGPHLGKVAVMGLLERHGEVRAKAIPGAKSRTILKAVRENVAPGATLYTDAFLSHRLLDQEYVREVIDHSESYVEGRIHTNGIENFWSLFKRVIYGTHHFVEPFHLDRYLAENTRKFNTRKLTDDARFKDTVRRVVGRHITYAELTGKLDPKGAIA